jgi:hypothetical protein
MSQAVEELEAGNASSEVLSEMGVDFVYVGNRRDFSGPGLSPDYLPQPGALPDLVYQSRGVSILQLAPSPQ